MYMCIHVCCIYMYLQIVLKQEEKYMLKQLAIAVTFI